MATHRKPQATRLHAVFDNNVDVSLGGDFPGWRVWHHLGPFGRAVSPTLQENPVNGFTLVAMCGTWTKASRSEPTPFRTSCSRHRLQLRLPRRLGNVALRTHALQDLRLDWPPSTIRLSCPCCGIRRTGDNTGVSTQRHVKTSPCSCRLTPVGEAVVATLRQALDGQAGRCARLEVSRLLWGSKRRPCGVTPTSEAFCNFRQSVWATDGRVPAGDVTRSVLQQPRLLLWALNALHFRPPRLVPTRGVDRSTVACSSALVEATKLSRQHSPRST